MTEAAALRAAGGLLPERGRIAVYSCYFGSYEPFYAPALGDEGDWDRIIFTDQPDLPAPGRRLVQMGPGFDGLTAKQMSRLPKLCPEAFLQNYDWVIYVDNRARLLPRADALIARIEAGQGGDAAPGRYLARHAQRTCAWRESRVCLRKGFFSQEEFDRIRAAFEAADFPRDAGLFVNTALVQKMGSEATKAMNAAWFQAFCTLGGRDQVLLPYVLHQSGHRAQALGFPLTEVIQWPVFGKRIRHRFQAGEALPSGWDSPVSGED